MLVNNKLDVSWQKGLPVKVGNFIGLLNFEWYSQNEGGNIGNLVLWRDRGKLNPVTLGTSSHIPQL